MCPHLLHLSKQNIIGQFFANAGVYTVNSAHNINTYFNEICLDRTPESGVDQWYSDMQ